MNQPVLDYQSPSPPRRLKPWVMVALIIGGSALAISVLLPSLSRTRDHPAHLRCASNLRQIGMAFLLYQNEFRGTTAPDFVTLLEKEDLVNEIFVCNSTSDTRSTATQPSELRRDFAAGGHCSYVYVGFDGPFSALTKNDILAYEPQANHGFAWTWVLFADRRIERVDVKQLNAALARRSGMGPVTVDPSGN